MERQWSNFQFLSMMEVAVLTLLTDCADNKCRLSGEIRSMSKCLEEARPCYSSMYCLEMSFLFSWNWIFCLKPLSPFKRYPMIVGSQPGRYLNLEFLTTNLTLVYKKPSHHLYYHFKFLFQSQLGVIRAPNYSATKFSKARSCCAS